MKPLTAIKAEIQDISFDERKTTIPRNPEMIRTEMGAIPMPFLNKEEAAPAFEKYFDRMHNMNVDAVRFGKQEQKPEEKAAAPASEHQQFTQSITMPGGGHPADAAKGPNGDTIVWDGKSPYWIDLITGKQVGK